MLMTSSHRQGFIVPRSALPIQLNETEALTLHSQIAALLKTQPDATALIFITHEGEQTLSTREFFENAARYAHALQQSGVRPGELVVLVLQHSLEVLYSFWGAIMLGAVPSIFPFLSEKLHPECYFDSVQKLIARSGVRAVITYADLKTPLEQILLGVEGLLPLLLVEELQPGGNSAEFLASISVQPDQTAFLQHSSGTTGLQKGVMLSHRAVINQLASYSAAIQLQPDDIICSWLPLYHDMGLIAGFILPMMQGIPLVLMSPFHWVRAPQILLQAIHKHAGTLCWLPNFAYNLMAQRIPDEQLAGIELSHVRAFINCSEPVRYESHQVFYQRYAPYGLRETALTTCYAMAENTFAVTQSQLDRPLVVEKVDRQAFQEDGKAILSNEESALAMVSCGTPIPNVEVQVVDEKGHLVAERTVGEIILRGDSMLSGYYELPDETQKALRGGWYFTGDLGYLAQGELFVSGRKKDLIIVGGKNIYPQDVEATVNEIEGVKAGRTVAFGVFNDKLGTEDVGVVAEIVDQSDETRGRIQREIRRRVVEALDINARFVHLVEPTWLIKTSSGKIARSANREKFMREIKLI